MAPALATAAAESEVDVSALTADAAYWQHHPLQIAMCLRNLISHHDRVTVTFDDDCQYTLCILDVDSRKGRFTFDVSNVDADNATLLKCDELSFSSLPGTIRTQFKTNGAIKVRFDERPAFETDFPSALYFAQRREHFRVHTPTIEPYIAYGVAPDGERFQTELYDMSLGGIALRVSEKRFGEWVLGTQLPKVEMHLGHFGAVTVDLEIMSPRCMTTPKGETQYIVGCRFLDRPAAAERLLQRVIMQLETSRQAAALRS
ncbi:flagellar brake protein [Robbsia sp. KACC 23696]|uniref:flagellar brake protein n=1 Tax=Robbsia sp. KACC 23696 TaxID=3149231 RepID=UPI00325A7490